MTTSAISKENLETVLQLYLDGASVPGLKNFSFVGPFGRRVSFASQQRRAFNTVWAVCQRYLDLSKTPNVAVVGAGIAGLTTCAALISKGCNVTLIEQEAEYASKQSHTIHRYVHPTVNFWPDQPLSSTTQLPFLDWYEDRCANVVQTIVDEWQAVFENSMKTPRMLTSVVDFEQDGDKALLKLRTLGNPSGSAGAEVARFDHVFMTTGFGSEQKIFDDDCSYWAADRLEAARNNGAKKFLVAGTGDGALIETLRILQEEFDMGRLSLRVIAEIEKANKAALLRNVDSDARDLAANDEEAASNYAKAYAEYCGELTPNVLTPLRHRHFGVKVRLVGKLPHPYQENAAPIHKLMLTQAILDGAVEYVQGELVREGDDAVIIRKDGSREIIGKDEVVTPRIGPKHPLEGLLDDKQIDHLFVSQRKLADRLNPLEMDDKFFRGHGILPARDIHSLQFAYSRLGKAAAFVLKRWESYVKVALSEKKPVYKLETQINNRHEDFPPHLFGIPLGTVGKVIAKPL